MPDKQRTGLTAPRLANPEKGAKKQASESIDSDLQILVSCADPYAVKNQYAPRGYQAFCQYQERRAKIV